jgi:hypothetical protein
MKKADGDRLGITIGLDFPHVAAAYARASAALPD